MMTSDEFDAMLADLAQKRMAMPGQAAEAESARRKAMMQDVMAQRKAGLAAIASKLAPYAQSPDALMAQQSAGDRMFLTDRYPRGGAMAAPAGDTEEDVARKAQLEATMKARSDAALRGRAFNQAENETVASQKDYRAERKATTRDLMDEQRKKNLQLAYARGVLNPGAVSLGIRDEILPDEATRAAKRAAMVAFAGNHAKQGSFEDEFFRKNPDLFEQAIRSKFGLTQSPGLMNVPAPPPGQQGPSGMENFAAWISDMFKNGIPNDRSGRIPVTGY